MTTGEVETLPTQHGLFKLQPAPNQPPRPDGLDLPFNLVRHGWSKGVALTMGLLRLVDQWVHKAHLVCRSTRNCTLCSAGASRLQTYSMLEKRAETLIFKTQERAPSIEVGDLSEPGWDLLEHRLV